MTDPPPSTMAPHAAAGPVNDNTTARTAPSQPPARPVTKSLVTRDFDLTLRAFFPTPTAPMKFNPISAMQQLLRTMIKDEPSLVIRTKNNDNQIILASEPLPSGEKEFKQFFHVSQPHAERQNQTHMCIGCNVLSNRTLGNIKFHSAENHLLAWLKKAKVFVESDSLGTERPVTVGYFTKLDPTITHLANFNEHLTGQLMMIDIDVDTAITLAPYLKQAQLDAMSNGDDVPILPNFEVYKTRLSHGRAPNKITTEVIGVKSEPKDAKLLGEFLTRMAAESSTDPCDGVYLPKGAVHLLGINTYEQVLKENNFFLDNVATIPVNMEYEAWFAVIDPANQSETEPISVHEHLIRQSWFLRLESVSRKKCLIVTTRSNLSEARKWIDENLHPLIRKSLPSGIDPPDALLPRRLDKPVYTVSSQMYADILKQQFSLASTPSTTNATQNQPSRKRQATLLDYAMDPQSEYPPLETNKAPNPAPTPVDYVAELAALKQELQSLRTLITTAVTQLKTEIASLNVTPASNDMETDIDHPTDHTPAIPELIAELKHDIATIALEMRAKFNQLTINTKSKKTAPT